MGSKAEREDKLLPSFSIDWCNLTDPPCPLKGFGVCGIKERLRAYPRKSSQRKEAQRLKEIAEKDPERYRRICEESLYRFP